MNSTDQSGGPVCGECGTSHDYGDCGLATTDSVGHEIVIEACPNCHTVYPVPPAMDHDKYEELIYE